MSYPVLLCLTIFLGPNQVQHKCLPVTIPEAFEVLSLTRNDPVMTCVDKYVPSKRAAYVVCWRPEALSVRPGPQA